METRKIFQIVGLMLFLSGGITWAQVTTGTISGTVKDSTGAVLPGAKVVLLNIDTGISRTVESDTEGRYSAPALALGNYTVTGTREGFQAEVRTGIVLTVGREAIVDLLLAVGTVTQTVEVTGDAPIVESTSASLGSLVDDRTIRSLPLNGRSYDQLALLQPGVILTSPGPTGNSHFLYGTGTAFSVGGQRGVSNSFLLDGTNINDQGNGTPGGAAGTNLGVDTILEFKIFTNSFKAEYGHSNGSVVSSITRSGTNTLHGTAFEYIRNSDLDARNFFDVGSSPPAFKRNQFGGVLGGPIKKDKTFFFVGYEGLRQGLATTQIATVPTALARQGILPTGTVPVNPVVVPFLDLYPLPNGRDFGNGTALFQSAPNSPTNEDNVMARVDEQLNAKTTIFARYTFDRSNVNAPASLPSLAEVFSSRRQYTTLQANSILSPKVLNNFRFAYNRTVSADAQVYPLGSGLTFVPGEPLGGIQFGSQSVGVNVLTAIGPTGANGPFTWAYGIFEEGDDLSYVTGKHSLKAGVNLQRIQDNQAQAISLLGRYSFTTYNTFLAGTPSNLSVAAPLGTPGYVGLRQNLYAAYVQDDYTVNARLTLNLGLRWEATTDPREVNGKSALLPSLSAANTVISDTFFSITKKNFEPRFGLAWRLNDSGKTVLRAGGGIYHNQILPWAYGIEGTIPPFYSKFSLNNPPFPNGYKVFPPLTSAGGGVLQIITMLPHVKTPVSDQYNLSIQQQIFKNTIVEVAYAGNKGNHLPATVETDTAVPIYLAPNNPFYAAGLPRRNPAWNGMIVGEPVFNSIYNSGTVKLRQQFSSGFQGQVFYTFSKAMDELSQGSGAESARSPAAPLDPNNFSRDWGLAEFDSRQSFGVNFSYALPFRAASKALGAAIKGWTLDGIATFTAGLPLSARLSAAVSRDLSSQLSERPNLVPGASQNPNQGTSAGCPGFPAGTPLGGAVNYFDPCAFSLPLAGTYGNLGRDTIIGPGLADMDLALEKSFKLREKANATFKAEIFNIMNHPNFGLPNYNALLAGGAPNPAAGQITSTITSSRQIQFALRISF